MVFERLIQWNYNFFEFLVLRELDFSVKMSMNVKQDNLYVLVMQNASTMLVITLVNVKKVSMVMEKSALVSVVVLHWAFLEKNCTPRFFWSLFLDTGFPVIFTLTPMEFSIFCIDPLGNPRFPHFLVYPSPPWNTATFTLPPGIFHWYPLQYNFFLEKPISYKFDCCFWNYFMIFCF